MKQNITETLGLTLVGQILESESVRQNILSFNGCKQWIIECDRIEDYRSLENTFKELIIKAYELNCTEVHVRCISPNGNTSHRLTHNVSLHIKSPLLPVSTPIIAEKVFNCTKPALLINNNTDQIYFLNDKWSSLGIITKPEEFLTVLDCSVFWKDKSDLEFVREQIKQGSSMDDFPAVLNYPDGSERNMSLDIKAVNWLGIECRAEIHKVATLPSNLVE